MAVTFSQDVFDAICERIANGESLRAICASDDMPSRQAFFKWLNGNQPLIDQYTRAREEQADAIFDECLTIADSQEGDVIVIDGEERTNHDMIARAKLRIDTRKWMAGKLRPKKYGDKVEVSGSGEGGEFVVVSKIERLIVKADNGNASD